MSESRRRSGKSCLVCRRRKVKCDKTKPVCFTCVKHNSEMQCIYDAIIAQPRKDFPIRFQSVVYGNSAPSISQTTSDGVAEQPPRHSLQDFSQSPSERISEHLPRNFLQSFSHLLSSSPRTEASMKGRIVEEINSLKQNFESLQKLLESAEGKILDASETYNTDGSKDALSLELRNFPPICFCDYDMIEVKAGRLSFTGPLSFQSFPKKDPFLLMITIMVRMERYSNYEKASRRRGHIFRKYPDIQYTEREIMEQLMSDSRVSKKRQCGKTRPRKSKLQKSCKTNDVLIKGKGDTIDAAESDVGNTPKGNDYNQSEHGQQDESEEDEDDDDDDDDDENYNGEEEDEDEEEKGKTVERKQNDEHFKELLIENESLDQINKIFQRNKKDVSKPLSLKSILNETEQFNSTGRPCSTSEKNSKSNEIISSGNIEVWKKLKTILNDLEELRHARLQLPVSNHRAHELLFSHSSAYQPNPEAEILVRIQAMLPPEKVIWLHIDNFFQSPIHGLYPVLNEDWFRDTMNAILGENRNREAQPIIKITRRFDFAQVGSLMIIIALSNLMCSTSSEKSTTGKDKYLLSFPIGKPFVDAAQMCMNLFKLLRKPALPVLHCGLMMRVYRRLAPEEGDAVDSGDTQSLTGLLVQMGFGIGLNTDAETCHQLATYEMYLQQWRKTWYLLFFFDLDEALNTGNKVLVDDNCYDTKLPTVSLDENGEFAGFITNPKLEIATVECIKSNYQMALALRKVLSDVTNKRKKSNCDAIQQLLAILESEADELYGKTLEGIISEPADDLESSVKKLNAFKGFMQTRKTLLSMYSNMFIHIDKHVGENAQMNTALPLCYLSKMLFMYTDVEPVLILLFVGHDRSNDAIEKIFGRGSTLIVMQICIDFIVKFPTVLYLILSRSLHFKFNYLNKYAANDDMEDTGDLVKKANLVTAIVDALLDKMSHVNSVLTKLAETNFQAWKASRGSLFMYSILKNRQNSLYNYNSKLNRFHRDLQGIINETGESQVKPKNNPINYFPKYNTFKPASITDLQEMYSILADTKWHIFMPYMTGSDWQLACDTRMDGRQSPRKADATLNSSETKDGNETPSLMKLSKRSVQSHNMQKRSSTFHEEVFMSNSPQSSTSAGEPFSQVSDAMAWLDYNYNDFDDAEGAWSSKLPFKTSEKSHESIIENPLQSNWDDVTSPPLADKSLRKDAPPNPDAPGDSGIATHSYGADIMGLDELFNNQFLLQDHVIKQLQQITDDQLSMHSTHNEAKSVQQTNLNKTHPSN